VFFHRALKLVVLPQILNHVSVLPLPAVMRNCFVPGPLPNQAVRTALPAHLPPAASMHYVLTLTVKEIPTPLYAHASTRTFADQEKSVISTQNHVKVENAVPML
jgi:hypothetical protein